MKLIPAPFRKFWSVTMPGVSVATKCFKSPLQRHSPLQRPPHSHKNPWFAALSSLSLPLDRALCPPPQSRFVVSLVFSMIPVSSHLFTQLWKSLPGASDTTGPSHWKQLPRVMPPVQTGWWDFFGSSESILVQTPQCLSHLHVHSMHQDHYTY